MLAESSRGGRPGADSAAVPRCLSGRAVLSVTSRTELDTFNRTVTSMREGCPSLLPEGRGGGWWKDWGRWWAVALVQDSVWMCARTHAPHPAHHRVLSAPTRPKGHGGSVGPGVPLHTGAKEGHTPRPCLQPCSS